MYMTPKSTFVLESYTYIMTKVSVLDLEIVIGPDGYIAADLYHQPSAGNTLLHVTSSHPTSLIKSIPFVEYLR